MNFLIKIKFKIKDIFASGLIRLSVAIGSPFLCSLGFLFAFKRLNNRGEYTVLCLGRTIFLDDIRALVKYSGRLRYLIIHFNYFQIIFDHFFGQKKYQLTERNYHDENNLEKEKENYFEFLKKVLRFFRWLVKYDAVFSGNFSYIMQQEIARAARENKVPLVVLMKEGIVVWDLYYNYIKRFLGCHFIGDKILFYNKKISEGFLSISLPGINRNNLEIVGVPRLDSYFQEKNFSREKKIVFFSFYPKDKFAYFKEENKDILEERSREFHKMVMNFAKKHPEFKVIIKTKTASQYYDYVIDLVEFSFKGGLTNLSVVNTGDPFLLIKDAIAVVGFNSTALIEGLIAGKTLISPFFGDIVENKCWDYFPDFPELINYAKCIDDLENYILNSKPQDSEKKNQFLEKFIYIPDGNASLRTEEAIIKLIKSF